MDKEQQMIDEGYAKVEFGNGGWHMKKGHITIDSSCFKHPESAISIGTLTPKPNEWDTELKSVGCRILELNKQDRKDFFKVYKLANKMMVKKMKDEETED